VRIPALMFAVLLGMVVGVYGSFVHQMQPRVGSVSLPAGLLLALAAELGLLVSTGLLLRSRFAVLAPAAGWLLTAFVFAVPRREGDLVVTSAAVGYLFLLGGSLLIGLALAMPYDVRRRPRPPRAPTLDLR
jgi:hypothetical protein